MIELKIHINNTLTLLSIKAVRVKPTGREPKQGEDCMYQVYINNKNAGKLIHPYGDGISLGKKMFEHYELFSIGRNVE